MSEDLVLRLAKQTLETVLLVSAPMLGAGLIVGIIAKLLMPGRDPGGFIVTILLGICGALIAGWLGRAAGWYGPADGAGRCASGDQKTQRKD